MEKDRKRMIIMVVTILAVISVLGLSYAYFTANLQGAEDTTTITVTAGTMNITFNGGNNITVSNIMPQDNPVATKTFTVTGNNTTDLTMPYTVTLIVDSNTFSNNAITYTLISTNTGASGTPLSSITNQVSIPTGNGTYTLGSGQFVSGTGKIHTYALNIYFPDTGGNQNADQNKTFKAHIGINGDEGGEVSTFANLLLNQDGGLTTINSKGNPNFTEVATSEDSGIYAAEDDYGTSYYYRGDRDILNNNLIFAGFQWKIIRVNGDGSIRVIYNGECPNNTCSINSKGPSTQIETSAFNDDYSPNRSIGYMYGTNSTTDYLTNHTNTNDSAIKTILDNWYKNNIINQGNRISRKIADSIFCNDRSVVSGTGMGSTSTTYGSLDRLSPNKTPSLKCPQQNDRFTVNDITLGNGSLTYPVGLITADEIMTAGTLTGAENPANYLKTDSYYWTMSPVMTSFVWYMDHEGEFEGYGLLFDDANGVTAEYIGIRPVINLTSDITVTGTGSTVDPFIVQ